MKKRGELSLYVGDEWVDIALYDPAGMTYAPVQVYTDNGWGAPFLRTDPSDADTPLDIYTETYGWVGVNTMAFDRIEDFEESGWFGRWAHRNTGTGTTVYRVNARARYSGKYGFMFDNLPDDHTAAMATAPWFDTPAYNIPSAGDTIEFYWRQRDSLVGYVHILFAVGQTGTYPEDTNSHDWSIGADAADVSLDDCYHLAVSPADGNATFRSIAGGHATTGLNLGFNTARFDSDTWYRWELDWRDSAENTIAFDILEHTGDGEFDSVLSRAITDTSVTTEHNNGGFIFGGHDQMHYDDFRILP